ncbi:MAG: M20 family metallo-hydrolase [Chitinophagaceae bacterium]|jgi:acetylornithine deacetylase|nr:M20 family metallo-hydrolase [Chitinophagaceae bacterium]
MYSYEILYDKAVVLLHQLIATPSFSREENETASIIGKFLDDHEVAFQREGNNIYAFHKYYEPGKPTLLLNSHHDTVKPNRGYTRDPFTPEVEAGKLYGLGSNDAGGCLVSLIMTFLSFYHRSDLPFNLVLAASAEEEVSGAHGIEMLLPLLGHIDCAIVGEPTLFQMAVAERGLMVLDCTAHGVAGHAARNEGENALYIAMEDIEAIRNFSFDRISPLLGETRMSVTVIETDNKQHNVVPPLCRFVTDVRVNELYTFEEVIEMVQEKVKSKVIPRSTRLRSTSISMDHPLVKAGLDMGFSYYGSPTTSDKALMSFPALKIGPGDSARSHMADEYIFLSEIKEGIEKYCLLIEAFGNHLSPK